MATFMQPCPVHMYSMKTSQRALNAFGLFALYLKCYPSVGSQMAGDLTTQATCIVTCADHNSYKGDSGVFQTMLMGKKRS